MHSSQRAMLLIITEEDSNQNYYIRHYEQFEWPGGSSGPTAAIGYDCGYCTAAEIEADWKGIVSDATVAALVAASGRRGSAGQEFVRAHGGSITITWDQAISEFQGREMPKWEAEVEKALPNTDKLSGDSFGALVSLAYNRGCSFGLPGGRYTEMRAIKAHMAAEQFDQIPNDFLSVRRLWPVGGDLWNRRGHEALLFRDGLVAPTLPPDAAIGKAPAPAAAAA